MSYSDQRFQTRQFKLGAPSASFGTATAAGAAGHTATDVVELPAFIRKTRITGIRLKVRTIPNAASTALIARAMNGTATIGTAVLTTATLGQVVDFTLSTGTELAANAEPTVNLVGTATASGAASGAYDVFFEFNELPS